MPEQTPNVQRASDFRFLASDAISFQFNDDVVKVVFALEDPNGGVLEQMGIMLSHSAGKLLMVMLSESIRRYEERTGTLVPLNPAKLDEVMKIFSALDETSASQASQPQKG